MKDSDTVKSISMKGEEDYIFDRERRALKYTRFVKEFHLI